MNIIVLIKQIPDIEKNIKITVDSKSYSINRQGIPSIMNPADKNALEYALCIKDQLNATVKVVTMGPPQAEAVLREAMSMGADEGYLATDRSFAGSDTLSTSLVLSKAIQEFCDKPDYIFCGHQALDGDTGQVGPGVAERFNFPQWIHVRSILEIRPNTLLVDRIFDGFQETIEIHSPSMVAFVKNSNLPRLPGLRNLFWAKDAPIKTITNEDLKIPPETIGISGSPTRVVRTFKIEMDKTVIKKNIETGNELLETMLEKIGEVK